jgi:hypothetical protein
MLGDWSPAKGCSLLIPSGSFDDPDRHHMFVMLTDACKDGFHLGVSVSSIKDGIKHDTACILKAGCHSFVTKDSFVMYGKVEKLHGERIKKCVNGWLYKPKENVSDEVLKSIQDGIVNSDFTPRWAQKYFAENSKKE